MFAATQWVLTMANRVIPLPQWKATAVPLSVYKILLSKEYQYSMMLLIENISISSIMSYFDCPIALKSVFNLASMIPHTMLGVSPSAVIAMDLRTKLCAPSAPIRYLQVMYSDSPVSSWRSVQRIGSSGSSGAKTSVSLTPYSTSVPHFLISFSRASSIPNWGWIRYF